MCFIPTREKEEEFTRESSEIESEYSDEAVADHLAAWRYLQSVSALGEKEILECHRLLQHRLRPDIAGMFRDCDVRVGIRVCPPHERVPELLEQWLEQYNNKPKTEKEIMKAHIEFEEIHPFEDGNGRVGRCILNWHRTKADMDLLIIHTGVEQYNYYDLFQ